jgi:hypothetical protein
MRVQRFEGVHRAGLVSTPFDEDVHVMSGSRPARPSADGVRPGQNKGDLFPNQRSQDLVEVNRGGRHLTAPHGPELLLQIKTLLDGVIVIDIPPRSLGLFPFRVAHQLRQLSPQPCSHRLESRVEMGKTLWIVRVVF